MIKRILSLALLAVMLLSLISCEKNREYNEKEVVAAAAELIKKTEALNVIYYGKGFMYDELSSEAIGAYKKVLEEEFLEYGINSLEKLESMTRAVYTSSYAEEIIKTKLGSVKDENGNLLYIPRYIERETELSALAPEEFYKNYDYKILDDGSILIKEIYAHTDYDIIFRDEIEYLYDTIKVSSVSGEFITVSIEINITNKEGKTKKDLLEITMLEETSGWRIDSPTFAVFGDYDDRYSELDKG